MNRYSCCFSFSLGRDQRRSDLRTDTSAKLTTPSVPVTPRSGSRDDSACACCSDLDPDDPYNSVSVKARRRAVTWCCRDYNELGEDFHDSETKFAVDDHQDISSSIRITDEVFHDELRGEGRQPSRGLPTPRRYRSRDQARKRSSARDCPYTPPSPRVAAALQDQRREVRNPHASLPRRAMALFYAAYLTNLVDIYRLVKRPRANSFATWSLACVCVSVLWASAALLLCAVLTYLIEVGVLLLTSVVRFIVFLFLCVIVFLVGVTLLSFQEDISTKQVCTHH